MNSSSGSDSEFDKFLQESLSSTVSSVSGITPPLRKRPQEKEGGEERQGLGKAAAGGERTLSSAGLSWLKRGVIEEDADEWINEQTRPTSSSNKRKTSTASVGDDPLNFSTGSSYSIISEIEHQLGLRSNKTTPPGQDTLNEEDEKKLFFEALEKGRGSSLDYSELNHQLDGSIRSTDRMVATNRTLKTIDEDVTPRVSDDSSSDHSLVISDTVDNAPIISNNVLLHVSPDSSTSTKHSFLHSREQMPSSVHKLIPIDTPTVSNKKEPVTNTNTAAAASTTNNSKLSTAIPNVDESTSNELHDSSAKSTVSSLSTCDIVLPSPHKVAFQSQSDQHISLISKPSHTNELHQLQSSVHHQQDITSPVKPPSLQTKHSQKSLKGNSPPVSPSQSQLSTVQQQPIAIQHKSPNVAQQLPQTKSSSFNCQFTSKEQTLSAIKTQPLSACTIKEKPLSSIEHEESAIQRQSRSLPSINTSNDSMTCMPIASSTTMPLPYTSSTLLPTSTGNITTHQEVTRTMNVEKLTNSSHDMLRKEDAVLPPLSPSTVPLTDELLHQQVHQWKQAWEKEKEKVKLKEEEIKECMRREEKLQLEYGQQIQTLRGELLEQRAKLRKVEREKNKSHSTGTGEQERLIQGYQKENEHLYNELTVSNKEMKSMKNKFLEDNNKLATELANMKDKHETQEEVIRHLHHQIDSSSFGVLQQRTNSEETVLKKELQESYDNCQKLQKQVDHLLHVNKGLERQLISLRNDKDSSIKESTTDNIPLVEISQMKQKYEKDILWLHGKLKKMTEEQEKLRVTWEMTLQEKNEEIKSLKEGHTARKNDELEKKVPRLIKSRTVADSRRIKDLEHQIHELQTALKTRHTNSIPALIYATHDKSKDSEEIVSYLEKKVLRLESELTKREDEIIFKMDGMKKQFHEIEALYEEQIASLKEQVSTAHSKVEASTNNKGTNDDDTIRKENVKLKEQISQLSLELTHQRLHLERLSAQTEGERRKSNEKWEHKIKRMEKEHTERMDGVIARLIQDHSESSIARFKSRLASRESRIKQLEDEIELFRVDSETLAVSRAIEEDLRNQIELLTQELEESKKHHTPEMHHFNSLLANIGHLENKLNEYQRKLAEANRDKDGFVSQDKVKEIMHKYKSQLSAKNKQIEKFREELDALMDTLHSLQENYTTCKDITI